MSCEMVKYMIIFVLLLSSALAKLISTTITMSPDSSWKYITKFAVDVGRGDWEMKAKFLKPINDTYPASINLMATVYLDENWEDVLNTDNCKQKIDIAKRDKQLTLPTNAEWSNDISGSVSQKHRPHVWYFAVSDCENIIKEKIRVKIEMHMTNSDGSEFSVEEKGLDYFYPVLLVVYLLTLSGNMIRLIRTFKMTDEMETNLLIFNISIGCQFSGILCQIIHYSVYAYNGKGISVFDFLSQAFEVLATLLITIELIIMANGWTIKYKDFPDPDIYIPISLLVVLLNLLIVGLGRITDDSHYKFSDYEGIPGWLLILIRIGLFAWFSYLVQNLYKTVNGKIKSFVLVFGVLGSVYLLSMPILVFISWFFASYVRNKVVIIGSTLIQVGVFFCLTHLFSKKSEFYKISTMSQSMLPGKYN